MCLSVVKSEKFLQSWLKKKSDKNGYITVYKLIDQYHDNGAYWSVYMGGRYKIGINVARTTKIKARNGVEYKAGFHFYANKQYPISHVGSGSCAGHRKLIKCRVHKSWITSCGIEDNTSAIVTNKAYFPSPKNKKAKVRVR